MDTNELDARMRELLGGSDQAIQSDLKALEEMRKRLQMKDDIKEDIEEVHISEDAMNKSEDEHIEGDVPEMYDASKFATPSMPNVNISTVKVENPVNPTQQETTRQVTITAPNVPNVPVQTMQNANIPVVNQPMPGVSTAPTVATNPFANQSMDQLQIPQVPPRASHSTKKLANKDKDSSYYEQIHANLMANYKNMENVDIFAAVLTLISEGQKRAVSAKSVADACELTPANRVLNAVKGKAMNRDSTQKVINYFWTNQILRSKYPDVLQLLQPEFFGYKIEPVTAPQK